jgi:hypothetical protein
LITFSANQSENLNFFLLNPPTPPGEGFELCFFTFIFLLLSSLIKTHPSPLSGVDPDA